MAQNSYKPVVGRRFLDRNIIKDMLEFGVKPSKLPLCWQEATTHAAGCSAAALLARGMKSNLNYLRNQIDICFGELASELDFVPEKLQEHIGLLRDLNLMFYLTTANRWEQPSDDESTETCNIFTQAFSKLPKTRGVGLRTFDEGVVVLLDLLHNHVLIPMEDLKEKISENTATAQFSDWESDIRDLLLNSVAPRLEKMYNILSDLCGLIAEIVEKIRADWGDNYTQLADGGHSA